MTSQAGKQLQYIYIYIYIYILPNVSRSKANQAMTFDQLIEHS